MHNFQGHDPDWGSKGMQKRQTQEDPQKSWDRMGLGRLLQRPQQPKNALYLSYKTEQRGGVIINSWTGNGVIAIAGQGSKFITNR